MDIAGLALHAVIAGTAVVLVTAAAARSSRSVAGVLAAAPVTPTFAVLLLGPSVPDGMLLEGMPIVAATAIAIFVVGGLHGRMRQTPLMALALVPFGVWVFRLRGGVLMMVVVTMLAALLVVGMQKGSGRSKGHRRNPLPVVVRFVVGAGSVAAVAAVHEWLPAWTPIVAVLPVMFVTSVLVVQVHVGEGGAAQVMVGGAAGVVGVAAFILAFSFAQGRGWTDLGALVIAWCAYSLVAAAWSYGVRGVRSWSRRRTSSGVAGPLRPDRIDDGPGDRA